MQTASSAPLLQVDQLVVRFEQADAPVDVVRSISFTVAAGRTLCLVGESGCGKSMTALALLRLLPEHGCIASGHIHFQGQDLTTLAEKALCRIRGRDVSMIFQEPMTALNPVLRIGEQVAEPLRLHEGLSRRDALNQAVALLRSVGIPDPERRIHDYPHQLSGGMRQRVMIAAALACKPKLLLADEPTTALDVTIQGQILSLLKNLTHDQGMGMVCITHDLGVVARIADDVGVMYAGKLVEQGTATAVLEHPLHPYTQGLMRSAPRLEALASPSDWQSARLPVIEGSVPPAGAFPQGCAFRPRCEKAHERCHEQPPDSEHHGHRVACWLFASK